MKIQKEIKKAYWKLFIISPSSKIGAIHKASYNTALKDFSEELEKQIKKME